VINFVKCALIVVLKHIFFVAFFNMFVFHLKVDVIGPLLLNTSLLLVLTFTVSDWCRSLNLLTTDNDGVF